MIYCVGNYNGYITHYVLKLQLHIRDKYNLFTAQIEVNEIWFENEPSLETV